MSKFVVVIFPDDKAASEGLRALKDLHAEGTITLYSNAVVQRSAEGLLSVKEEQTAVPVGVGVGALLGGLIGLFAGPVGAVAGLTGGTGLGALRDLFNLGVSDDFLATISNELSPGKTALVAEIAEEWITPLDTRMSALGGIVIREYREDFIDEQLKRHIEDRKEELVQRKAEFAAARAEKRETMKAAVTNAQQKLHAATDKARERAKHYHEETQAKIHALEDQAKKAQADAKARINERIAEIRADQKQRADKLKEAWSLTKEALRP